MQELQLEIKGLTEFNVSVDRLQHLLARGHIAAKVAADARNLIEKRTLGGKDVYGNAFKTYSSKPYYRPADARPKGKGGRTTHKKTGSKLQTLVYDEGYGEFKRLTTGDDTPNLFASGDMMRSMQAQEDTPTRARVAFTRRLPAVKAFINNAERTFMGIDSKKEEPLLHNAANALVKRLIREAGL